MSTPDRSPAKGRVKRFLSGLLDRKSKADLIIQQDRSPASASLGTAPPLSKATADTNLPAGSSGPNKNIPDEVIHLICQYAQDPKPTRTEAHDPASDTARYSQTRLATLMRQCSLITREYLYKDIVTDNLASLLYGACLSTRQAKSDRYTRQKPQCLELCRHLHLELHPSLKDLSTPRSREQMQATQRSAKELQRALQTIIDQNGLKRLLPNLETLSTAA